MRSVITVLMLVLSIAPGHGQKLATSSKSSDAIAKLEIEKLERDRNQAIVKGDAAALDRMTSDDYTFVTLLGEMRTKAEIIQGFKSGSFHYESRRISDLNVRVYGDAAVVTGRSVQSGKENGKDYSGDYLFTRMYVKRDGRWMTVALQATRIQP